MTEREELVPVTSEAQLRAGGLYVIKSCASCGGDHRFILLTECDCEMGRGVDWAFEPPGCVDTGVGCQLCPHLEPLPGRLYEVRTCRDDEVEQERRREQDEYDAAERAMPQPARAR